MTDAEQKVRDRVIESQSVAKNGVPPISWIHLTPKVAADIINEIDQLRETLGMYQDGYQGSCMACIPVAKKNQQLREALIKAIPIVAETVRKLRAKNDMRSLQMTNDLADMRRVLKDLKDNINE